MIFCAKVRKDVSDFMTKMDEKIQATLPVVLHVAETIKKAIDSGLVVTFTDLTPITWDNELRSVVSNGLEIAINELTIYEECKGKSFGEKLACFQTMIKALPPAMQSSVYHKLSALLLKYAHGSQLAQNVYDTFVQTNYSFSK